MSFKEPTIDSFAKKGTDKSLLPTQEKSKELIGRLATIIQTVSGKMDLQVTTALDPLTRNSLIRQQQDPDNAWFRFRDYNRKSGKAVEYVHIPEKITESHEDFAKGKAAHEGGHVAITRLGDFVPDEVMKELGFGALMASAEERPTDMVVKERFSGAGEWLDATRKNELRHDDTEPEMIRRIGQIPKFAQLRNLLVYGPYYDELPNGYSPEVLETYEKTKADMENMERILPKENASEHEIVQKARERYKIFYRKVWKEAKKLVDQDVNQESLRQMIEQDQKQGGEMMKQLEDSIRKKLEEILEQAKKKQQADKQDKREEGKKNKGEKQDGDDQTGKGQTNDEQETEGDSNKEKNGETAKEGGQKSKKSEPGEKNDAISDGSKISMDELPPEIIEALKKVFDSLPKEKQDELKKIAKENLEKIEDELIKKTRGSLDENQQETHEERQKRQAEEAQAKTMLEEVGEIRRELEKIDRKQAALQEDKTKYDKYYETIREIDDKLYRELEEIFTPNTKRKVRLNSVGANINLSAVFRWDAEKSVGLQAIDNRVFEQVHIPEKKDYSITILVDLSGSMRGERIEETFKGVVLLTEVLNRLGVANEILGFQDEVIIFKEFSQDLDETIRKKITGMVAEVYNENRGGHNRSDYNDDGPCVWEASQSLGKQASREKFLLVLSDGRPAGIRSDRQDLQNSVEKILTETDQKLIGVGLGKAAVHVKDFYPTSLPGINTEELAEKLGDLLKNMIENPNAYSYKK